MTTKTNGITVFLMIAFGLAWMRWEIPIRVGVSVRNPMYQLAASPVILRESPRHPEQILDSASK